MAGIGLALGSGFYRLAFAATLLILVVLFVLGRVARVWPNGKSLRWSVRVVSDEPATRLDAVREIIAREKVPISGWSYKRLSDGHAVVIECDAPRSALPGILARVSAAPGIRSARSL